MTQAAESPVQTSVPQPHRDTDVGSDLGVLCDQKIGRSRIVHRVAHDAGQASLQQPLAVRLDERQARPYLDAEGVCVAVCSLDQCLTICERDDERHVHVEGRPGEREHAVDRLVRAVEAHACELRQPLESCARVLAHCAHAVLSSAGARARLPTSTTASSRSHAAASFVMYRTAPASRAHCLH